MNGINVDHCSVARLLTEFTKFGASLPQAKKAAATALGYAKWSDLDVAVNYTAEIEAALLNAKRMFLHYDSGCNRYWPDECVNRTANLEVVDLHERVALGEAFPSGEDRVTGVLLHEKLVIDLDGSITAALADIKAHAARVEGGIGAIVLGRKGRDAKVVLFDGEGRYCGS